MPSTTTNSNLPPCPTSYVTTPVTSTTPVVLRRPVNDVFPSFLFGDSQQKRGSQNRNFRRPNNRVRDSLSSIQKSVLILTVLLFVSTVPRPHKALTVPELLATIFLWLSRADLASVARVCRFWSPVALDILWQLIPDLDCLLSTFYGDI